EEIMVRVAKNITFILLILESIMPAAHSQSNDILFENPLDGVQKAEWIDNPTTFVDHPKFGKAFHLQSAKSEYPTTSCWIGDESWGPYRVEFECLCEGEGGGFIGLDFFVSNDGEHGCNFEFYIPKSGDQIAFEHTGRWGKNAVWKLWPFSPPQKIFAKEKWIPLRLDAGETIANLYANGDPNPAYTIYDLPFSKGGVRFWEYYGSAYFRNLRVTKLAPGDVKPILDDVWEKSSRQIVIKEWQITPKQTPEFGTDKIPDELKTIAWKPLSSDRRGIVNLTAQFPSDMEKGVVFAKTSIQSKEKAVKKALTSYTDRLTVWINGEKAFQGPPRGFYDPGRSFEDGFGRILPDQFEFEIKLKPGENEILLRSELTEPRWGWGYWMRVE
ncbi:MAG: hypothetical protein AB1656_11670, partial [Candidatus Omnitrophota bacterium]